METATLGPADIDDIGTRLARLLNSRSWRYDPLLRKVLFIVNGDVLLALDVCNAVERFYRNRQKNNLEVNHG